MKAALGLGAVTFGLISAYFLYSGFVLTTDVPNPEGYGTIANLQLMHIQATNFAVGIGAGIVAAILSVGAAIVSEMSDD